MDWLQAADRKVLLWALVAWVLIAVIGSFWAFPKVERDLAAESLTVASFTQTQGAELTWHGRDGYLSVPSGTADAEAIAADLAALDGARDVEVSFAKAATPAAPSDQAAPPAAFVLEWSEDGILQLVDGELPANSPAALLERLGSEPSPGAAALDPDAATVISDRIMPLVGSELTQGRLTVNETEVRLEGTGLSLDGIDAVETNLSASGLSSLSTQLRAPASFDLTWLDPASAAQDGVAPEYLSDTLSELGVTEPVTDPRLFASEPSNTMLKKLAAADRSHVVFATFSTSADSTTLDVVTNTADAAVALESELGTDGASLSVDSDEPTETVDESDAGAQAAEQEIAELLALERIEFVSGTATPTQATSALIGKVATVLSEYPNIAVTIIGHTDSQGAEAANQALSEARAQAVVDALVTEGIDAERLDAVGFGESQPIASNDTPEGRQQNRRVEIDIKENA